MVQMSLLRRVERLELLQGVPQKPVRLLSHNDYIKRETTPDGDFVEIIVFTGQNCEELDK